jgi:thioredoxin 2
VNQVDADRPAREAVCRCNAALFTGAPIKLSMHNFDSLVERGEIPFAVHFWAPWSGPCRAMAPIFEQAAREFEPRARFGKLNIDEEQPIMARYGVRSVPTIAVFHHRSVARLHAGLVNFHTLRQLVGVG